MPNWNIHNEYRHENQITGAYLEFSALCKNSFVSCASKELRRSELKLRTLEALLFSLSLLTLGCRPDKSSSLGPASPSIGSNVGQKMPPFAARDQFGEEKSSETLKGSNGTVLLFFRSADW